MKMTVVSSLGDLEDLGSVKEYKRIRGGSGSGKELRGKI